MQKSLPQHVLCENTPKTNLQIFVTGQHSLTLGLRRGRHISSSSSPASLPPLAALEETQPWSWCQLPNPGAADRFLPCPRTKGSTRCHGTDPASSCWRQTPAPSASSDRHFKFRGIPVDSARVQREFHHCKCSKSIVFLLRCFVFLFLM